MIGVPGFSKNTIMNFPSILFCHSIMKEMIMHKKSFVLSVAILLLFPLRLFSFTDESHYSVTFGSTRYFRVFTPVDYSAENCSKRYPVIYYFHGCGGSYKSSGTYSYPDYGLTAPLAAGRTYVPDFEFPNNADFDNYAAQKDVIIVCVDGKIYDLPTGCGVYFPSQVENWGGNYYNFSSYMRELIDAVDSRYNTKTGPEFRAVSGLSMGGQMAIWIAATNPHLFSSASEFCHSPTYYDVGEPVYMTTIDIQQLWRNLRGLPFRHSTNDRDYLKYFTAELYSTYSGAGFKNEYYLADFCKHHAARVDLQFDFHLNHFVSSKKTIPCFSYINLYPGFEVWGYELNSTKKGNGWIYLHSVKKNGFGIYTRKRFPWGSSLPGFDISLKTPPIYNPGSVYRISRYSYCSDMFTNQDITADSEGRLVFASSGGMGEEIGILGNSLQPPVFVLTDTVNENIYLEENVETALSFDIVNLSMETQKIDFLVSTENNDLLTFLKRGAQITIPSMTKVRVDSLVVCKGFYHSSYRNKGYIKITSSIDGVVQERDHIIQVTVKNQVSRNEHINIKVFDGRSDSIALYKYGWGKWIDPLSSGLISEGSGNGNGRAEMGEAFSIWIQPSSSFDSADIKTWHPVVPVNTDDNPDIIVDHVMQHNFSTGRTLLSAEMRLQRKPEKGNPVRIPVQSEFLKVEPLKNGCSRDVADNFGFYYYEILLYEDGTAAIGIISD